MTIPENPTSIYELYAISNHYGSLSGGHYTAFAKNGNKWYSFNDSSVSSISQDKIKGSGAYILFYRRKPAWLFTSLTVIHIYYDNFKF